MSTLIDLTQYSTNIPEDIRDIIELLGIKLLYDRGFFPLFLFDKKLTIAMVDPDDIHTYNSIKDIIKRETGYYIDPKLLRCDRDSLDYTLSKVFPEEYPADLPKLPDQLGRKIAELPEDEIFGETIIPVEKIHRIASEEPVVRWVNRLLIKAVRERASDIHIEPKRNGSQVRFRIDGQLQPVVEQDKNFHLPIVSRIKIMSKMNIAEKRLPQDGRYGAMIDKREIDFRVSTFPTNYGEAVVLRILDRARVLTLNELGVSSDRLNTLKEIINAPVGMILITGPTGSGKTTTIYAILSEIKAKQKNIITIEDPIEYDIEGVRQSQINLRAGFTFLTGLNNILRQDPDVIMIGEIRNVETAQIAIRAALTGQVVFSTLHTNDAPSTATRLIDMGVEPYLLTSALQGAVAQRLVRKVCPKCKKEYNPPAKEVKSLTFPSDIKFYHGTGCAYCNGTGYFGRVGIFEILPINDEIRDLMKEKASSKQIRDLAIKEMGMKTLWEDGVDKIKAGITNVEEVLRETRRKL
jgi:type II secretory ATPase GspE/PulE/Tfp pilus assembly ATPase PilB-like protein